MQPPTEGIVHVQQLDGNVMWKISSGDVAGDSAEGMKKKVVWDLDLANLDKILASKSQLEWAPETPTISDTFIDYGTVQITPRTEAESPLPSRRSEFHAVYSRGETLEYLSTTHGQWLMAHVTSATYNVTQNCMVYDVKVGIRQQLRRDVPLKLLRVPLRDGELVELFSMRRGGTWVNAIISSAQFAQTKGYRATLEDEGIEMPDLPGIRIRRRFAKGDHVDVYGGPDRGWMTTVVAGVASDAHQTGEFLDSEFNMDGASQGGVKPNTFDYLKKSATTLLAALTSPRAPRTPRKSLVPPLEMTCDLDVEAAGLESGQGNMSDGLVFDKGIMAKECLDAVEASSQAPSSDKLAGTVPAIEHWTNLRVQLEGVKSVPSYLVRRSEIHAALSEFGSDTFSEESSGPQSGLKQTLVL